jgi:lipopolysaccharide O-acetyltransferase
MFKFKGYSLFHTIYLTICFLFTKIFYRKSRLIRLPFRIRNSGVLIGGEDLTTGVSARVDIFDQASLTLGKSIQINDYIHIACAKSIEIGDNTLIASKVFITDHDHDLFSEEKHPQDWPLSCKEVIIGRDCWIGEGVAILKGVVIGDSCVIGANSVVTKSFPENSIIAGVPAKIIKMKEV